MMDDEVEIKSEKNDYEEEEEIEEKSNHNMQ